MQTEHDHVDGAAEETPWKLIGVIAELDQDKRKKKGEAEAETPEDPCSKESMVLVETPEGARRVPLSEAWPKIDESQLNFDAIMPILEKWILEWKAGQDRSE